MDNTVGSNDSSTIEVLGDFPRVDLSTSQDSPYLNASEVDSEITSNTLRYKATKLVLEMAKGALDEAEQALNKIKIAGTNNNGLAPPKRVTTQSWKRLM